MRGAGARGKQRESLREAGLRHGPRSPALRARLIFGDDLRTTIVPYPSLLPRAGAWDQPRN